MPAFAPLLRPDEEDSPLDEEAVMGRGSGVTPLEEVPEVVVEGEEVEDE